jgi:hypothetical protein
MLINDLTYAIKVRKDEIHKWIVEGCPHDLISVDGKLKYWIDARELDIWRYKRGLK